MKTDPCFLTIAEAAELIRKRKLSPVELTQAHLERISRSDGELRSFITVSGDLALDQARQAANENARGRATGPLHGIPITYKDVIATAGVRTTAASRVLEDWVPGKDAHVVTRLREAGAVTLGKVNLGEFTLPGGHTENDFTKPPRNPWNLKYTASGSSSGSAVSVAAGMAMGSVGGDSGGSIRLPAERCGITGLKPTYGRIGRSGVIPLSYSMDHLGPMTRTVEDTAIMLEAMAGHDPNDRASSREGVPAYRRLLSRKVRGLKIARCPAYLEAAGVEDQVLSALDAALDVFRSLGMGGA